MTCLDNFEDRCFERSIHIEEFIRRLLLGSVARIWGKKSLQEPSSASSSRNVIGELLSSKDLAIIHENQAGANHISGKYDVTIAIIQNQGITKVSFI